jgi:predicted O-methyltransferase YrrM
MSTWRKMMSKPVIKILVQIWKMLPTWTQLRLLSDLVAAVKTDQFRWSAEQIANQAINHRDYLYGAFPPKLAKYEQCYQFQLGGWFDQLQPQTISYGSVELEVGRFYYSLVRLLQPHSILETGTFLGYSTSCLASGLRDIQPFMADGAIITIDPWRVAHLWEGTDIEPYITWMNTTSQQAKAQLKGQMFDMLVLDSDHSYQTISQELELYEPQLRVGGYILMHDTLYFDGVGAAAWQLYQNPRFEVVTLDTPRHEGRMEMRCPGLSLVRKIRAGKPTLRVEKPYANWQVGDVMAPPFLRGKIHDQS